MLVQVLVRIPCYGHPFNSTYIYIALYALPYCVCNDCFVLLPVVRFVYSKWSLTHWPDSYTYHGFLLFLRLLLLRLYRSGIYTSIAQVVTIFCWHVCFLLAFLFLLAHPFNNSTAASHSVRIPNSHPINPPITRCCWFCIPYHQYNNITVVAAFL